MLLDGKLAACNVSRLMGPTLNSVTRIFKQGGMSTKTLSLEGKTCGFSGGLEDPSTSPIGYSTAYTPVST
jgi:hypothetical protein